MTERIDLHQSAARIGIGGPVGSGKTALVERLIPAFHDADYEIAVVTNDLVTREDAERLKRGGLIDPARVRAGRNWSLPAHCNSRRSDPEYTECRRVMPFIPRPSRGSP